MIFEDIHVMALTRKEEFVFVYAKIMDEKNNEIKIMIKMAAATIVLGTLSPFKSMFSLECDQI